MALAGLFCDIYFPEWRLAVLATIIPAGFCIAVLKKLHGQIGFWMLLAAFTILFSLINARIHIWMNGLGLLSLIVISFTEALALGAVVVRVYPEAKTR